jgi:hypothetical protein
MQLGERLSKAVDHPSKEPPHVETIVCSSDFDDTGNPASARQDVSSSQHGMSLASRYQTVAAHLDWPRASSPEASLTSNLV